MNGFFQDNLSVLAIPQIDPICVFGPPLNGTDHDTQVVDVYEV